MKKSFTTKDSKVKHKGRKGNIISAISLCPLRILCALSGK